MLKNLIQNLFFYVRFASLISVLQKEFEGRLGRLSEEKSKCIQKQCLNFKRRHTVCLLVLILLLIVSYLTQLTLCTVVLVINCTVVVKSSNVSSTKKLTCPTTLGSSGSYRLLSQLKRMARRRRDTASKLRSFIKPVVRNSSKMFTQRSYILSNLQTIDNLIFQTLFGKTLTQ